MNTNSKAFAEKLYRLTLMTDSAIEQMEAPEDLLIFWGLLNDTLGPAMPTDNFNFFPWVRELGAEYRRMVSAQKRANLLWGMDVEDLSSQEVHYLSILRTFANQLRDNVHQPIIVDGCVYEYACTAVEQMSYLSDQDEMFSTMSKGLIRSTINPIRKKLYARNLVRVVGNTSAAQYWVFSPLLTEELRAPIPPEAVSPVLEPVHEEPAEEPTHDILLKDLDTSDIPAITEMIADTETGIDIISSVLDRYESLERQIAKKEEELNDLRGDLENLRPEYQEQKELVTKLCKRRRVLRAIVDALKSE